MKVERTCKVERSLFEIVISSYVMLLTVQTRSARLRLDDMMPMMLGLLVL